MLPEATFESFLEVVSTVDEFLLADPCTIKLIVEELATKHQDVDSIQSPLCQTLIVNSLKFSRGVQEYWW